MSTDDILFYGSSLMVLILNLALLKRHRWYSIVNLIIQLLYTAYFNYGLHFHSQGGSALVWWFYQIATNCLHFLVSACYGIIACMRTRKKNRLA